MLTYDIGQRGGLPIYEYLYREIKNDIIRGNLRCGSKLPSKRALAAHLSISVSTVESAYEQLIAEGYLSSEEKRGYYVCSVMLPMIPIADAALPYTEAAHVKIPNADLVNFKDNSVSTDGFPFNIWARIMRRVILDSDKKLLKSVPMPGIYELRKAISEHIRSFRGIFASPEQIIVGAGTEYMYNIIIQLLGNSRIYAAENPGHSKIAGIYAVNGAECRFVDVGADGIDVKMLGESGADIVHISPSHHFPTGVVTSASVRGKLLCWAYKDTNRYIIEDDYDSEFRFDKRPLPSLFSMDNAGRVIYINTFSKSIAPSIRVSYMVLPEKLLSLFRKKLGFYSCSVSSLEQHALACFIGEGYFEKHINRMKKLYKIKRDIIIKTIIESKAADKHDILEEDAGLHFLLRIHTALSDGDVRKIAEDNGIKLSFLSDYIAKSDRTVQQHMAVINYSGFDSETLKSAAFKLTELIKKL